MGSRAELPRQLLHGKGSKVSTDLLSVFPTPKVSSAPHSDFVEQEHGLSALADCRVILSHLLWLPTHHVLGTPSNPQLLMASTLPGAALG